MSGNQNLFAQRDWLNPTEPREPILWIQQIRLLYRLEADQNAEIRRVNLQRGLNIVWAKPADADEANPAARGRGHDVGKTSFCRLIRYLLGEEHYGNEDLRLAIAGNEKFGRAWVLGEIVLDGKIWTVARALYTGAHHFAIRGATIDDVLVKPPSERSRYEDFVTEVGKKIVGKFAVRTFDDAGQRPILWLHVLQWLARDQEAHLSGLFKWRDPSSDHKSPELSADDAQYLARCVLGVTDVEERKLIETRNQLARDKVTQTDNSRYYERRIREALERARSELPGGKTLPNVGEALFVDVVEKHAKQLTEAKRGKLRSKLGRLNLSQLEAMLENAIGARAVMEGRYNDLKALVDETKDALARFTDKRKPTRQEVDDLDRVLAKLKPDRAFCEIPVNIALFQCPLLQKGRLAGDPQGAVPENITKLAEEKREHIKRQLAGLERNLRQLKKDFDKSNSKESACRKSRDLVWDRHLELKEELASLDEEAASWRIRAEDAVLSHKRLEAARSDLKQLESALELSKTKQDAAQKAAKRLQGDVTDVFLAVCRFFKGEQADAELKFTRDEINARIGSGGGAFTALSSLSFDFAAVIARINQVGQHPGFLIHDSPRESDMEPSLYRPLFQLMHHLEQKAPNSFQYIITTTEPPPSDLAAPPNLCLFLDGSTAEGKLFKENL
jgi:septal ring factor EnvC (AmiA/AmiB activator)